MDFTIAEVGLARKLGRGRGFLREWRGELLTEGVDWAQVGKSVMLTSAGAEKMARRAGVACPPAPIPAEPDTEEPAAESPVLAQTASGNGPSQPAAPPAPIAARVVRADYPNRQIILVEFLEGKFTHPVRVKDASKFLRGMAVPVRPEADHYVLARHAPRWRGKW